MDKITHSLNTVLMETYHNILRIEERTLKENSRVNLSIAEMHMIECIGKGGHRRRTASNTAANSVTSNKAASNEGMSNKETASTGRSDISADTGRGRTVSSIAKALGITRPSATVAVNKLVQKGYVEKESNEKDGRIVKVFLTHRGEVIDRYHRYYHRLMVKELSEEFTQEERECLVRAIKKLNDYFLESLGEKGKRI